MSQLSYSDTMAVAFAGMLYDLTDNDIVSSVSQESSLEIPFGVGVCRGTVDSGVKLPAVSTAKMKGVAVHSHAYEPLDALGTVGVKPTFPINTLRRGRIWVIVEEAVVPGDRAFVRFAAGSGGSQLGAWRKSEVLDETLDLTAECEFQSTADALGLAVLECNFTNS